MIGQRILVTGGRDYTDRAKVYETLDKLQPSMVCHGGANGADHHADRWAKDRQIPVMCYPAQWLRLGKPAGPIRNRQMLTEFRPDLVIQFPGGAGTAHCAQSARDIDIPVLVIV